MTAIVKLIAVTFSAIAVLGAAGCIISSSPPVPGSGMIALQEREVKEFDEIELRCAAKVIVTIGEPASILVQTDDNLIDLIETRFTRDTLRIECDRNIAPVNELTVTITVPHLKDLQIRGSGEVEVNGLNESEFALTITGSGDVTVTGTAERVDASIRGSGNMRLDDLIAKSLELSITGSGDANVHAEEQLEVHITGAGDVVYSGDPKSVSRHITGSGNVRKRD